MCSVYMKQYSCRQGLFSCLTSAVFVTFINTRLWRFTAARCGQLGCCYFTGSYGWHWISSSLLCWCKPGLGAFPSLPHPAAASDSSLISQTDVRACLHAAVCVRPLFKWTVTWASFALSVILIMFLYFLHFFPQYLVLKTQLYRLKCLQFNIKKRQKNLFLMVRIYNCCMWHSDSPPYLRV